MPKNLIISLLFSRNLIVTNDASALETSIKAKLVSLVDTMKDLHFEVIRSDILLSARINNANNEFKVTTETRLTNGVKIDKDTTLVDALFTVR